MSPTQRPASGAVALRGLAAVTLLGVATTHGDVVQLDSKADWSTWTIPPGSLELSNTGNISLGRIDRNINAVANAREFSHKMKSTKDLVPGGIRIVGSGVETADNLIDGREDTWWEPAQEDRLAIWWIEVDLGRMVLAKKIKLTFPDTLGVRPFRNFSLYVNDGMRATSAKDVFQFTRVGRTTEPNEERTVEYTLQTVEQASATGDYLATGDTLDFAMVQYVRFVSEEHHPGAALAEIEVTAIGDNVVLGSVERGGGVRGGTDLSNLLPLVDGDKNTIWSMSGTGEWISSGHWFELDAGVVYWVDRAFVDVRRHKGGFSFELVTSAGGQTGLTAERVRSNFDFQELSLIDNAVSPVRMKFDLQFPLRKARYAFFHSTASVYRQLASINEFMIFGKGYVAEVEMISDFMDLGGTSSLRRLTWDADIPPGTFVEIRSQTGDTFFIEKKFFSKNGLDISEAQWNKLPKSQKQDVVEIQRRGSDWSGWSQVYSFPEEVFLSPSPRRYVQLSVKLGNNNPDVTPLLRSIALHFDDALISGGLTSRIFPRQVGFDSLQVFTYTLKPTFRFGDQGFDRVHIQVPSPVDEVEVRVGGAGVTPLSVTMVGDSLQVDLPGRVQGDSVEVDFQARIQMNATQFDAWVSVAGEALQQGVRPEEQHASTVFVPAVATGGSLIRGVDVSPVLTPNLDGINDEASIRFVLAKVEAGRAEVSIHDLSGRQVRRLDDGGSGHDWDGRDDNGQLLPPGTYICKIALAADVGEQTAHRIIRLAY